MTTEIWIIIFFVEVCQELLFLALICSITLGMKFLLVLAPIAYTFHPLGMNATFAWHYEQETLANPNIVSFSHYSQQNVLTYQPRGKRVSVRVTASKREQIAFFYQLTISLGKGAVLQSRNASLKSWLYHTSEQSNKAHNN